MEITKPRIQQVLEQKRTLLEQTKLEVMRLAGQVQLLEEIVYTLDAPEPTNQENCEASASDQGIHRVK